MDIVLCILRDFTLACGLSLFQNVALCYLYFDPVIVHLCRYSALPHASMQVPSISSSTTTHSLHIWVVSVVYKLQVEPHYMFILQYVL